jgi:hypothetical protein
MLLTTARNPITADIKGKLKNKKNTKTLSTITIQIPHKKTAINNMNAVCGNTSKSMTVENNRDYKSSDKYEQANIILIRDVIFSAPIVAAKHQQLRG